MSQKAKKSWKFTYIRAKQLHLLSIWQFLSHFFKVLIYARISYFFKCHFWWNYSWNSIYNRNFPSILQNFLTTDLVIRLLPMNLVIVWECTMILTPLMMLLDVTKLDLWVMVIIQWSGQLVVGRILKLIIFSIRVIGACLGSVILVLDHHWK